MTSSSLDKLLTSEERELRRSLLSLKQTFQVGTWRIIEQSTDRSVSLLQRMIKISSRSSWTIKACNVWLKSVKQQVISFTTTSSEVDMPLTEPWEIRERLRPWLHCLALSQLMLYVDGMNAVINQNEVIQWLYSLLEHSVREPRGRRLELRRLFFHFQFGLVVKTSLKLLIIFGEYVESNALLILAAVGQVDRSARRRLWTNAMKILCDTQDTSSEIALLIMTLFNTVLSALPDQDKFYDMTDALEEQGMQRCSQFYLNKLPAEAELIEQFHIYDVSERWTLSVCSFRWMESLAFVSRLLCNMKMEKMIEPVINASGQWNDLCCGSLPQSSHSHCPNEVQSTELLDLCPTPLSSDTVFWGRWPQFSPLCASPEQQSMVKTSVILRWFSLPACLFSLNSLLVAFHRRAPRTASTQDRISARHCSMIEFGTNSYQPRRLNLVQDNFLDQYSYSDLTDTRSQRQHELLGGLNRTDDSPASSDHDDSDEYACWIWYCLCTRLADFSSAFMLRYSPWFSC